MNNSADKQKQTSQESSRLILRRFAEEKINQRTGRTHKGDGKTAQAVCQETNVKLAHDRLKQSSSKGR